MERHKYFPIYQTEPILNSLTTQIDLNGCETWTYNANIENRMVAFEMRCYRRLIGITWRQRITNEAVKQKIRDIIRGNELLLEVAS